MASDNWARKRNWVNGGISKGPSDYPLGTRIQNATDEVIE